MSLGLLIIQPRMTHAGTETQEPSMLSTTQSLRLMMNFLTLSCNASLRLRSEVSVSAFLCTTATYISKFDCSRLICHLLTTLSTIGDSRSKNFRTQNRFPGVGVKEIPWEIALSFPRSDLLVAGERMYLNPGSWSSRMVQRASRLVC